MAQSIHTETSTPGLRKCCRLLLYTHIEWLTFEVAFSYLDHLDSKIDERAQHRTFTLVSCRFAVCDFFHLYDQLSAFNDICILPCFDKDVDMNLFQSRLQSSSCLAEFVSIGHWHVKCLWYSASYGSTFILIIRNIWCANNDNKTSRMAQMRTKRMHWSSYDSMMMVWKQYFSGSWPHFKNKVLQAGIFSWSVFDLMKPVMRSLTTASQMTQECLGPRQVPLVQPATVFRKTGNTSTFGSSRLYVNHTCSIKLLNMLVMIFHWSNSAIKFKCHVPS